MNKKLGLISNALLIALMALLSACGSPTQSSSSVAANEGYHDYELPSIPPIENFTFFPTELDFSKIDRPTPDKDSEGSLIYSTNRDQFILPLIEQCGGEAGVLFAKTDVGTYSFNRVIDTGTYGPVYDYYNCTSPEDRFIRSEKPFPTEIVSITESSQFVFTSTQSLLVESKEIFVNGWLISDSSEKGFNLTSPLGDELIVRHQGTCRVWRQQCLPLKEYTEGEVIVFMAGGISELGIPALTIDFKYFPTEKVWHAGHH